MLLRVSKDFPRFGIQFTNHYHLLLHHLLLQCECLVLSLPLQRPPLCAKIGDLYRLEGTPSRGGAPPMSPPCLPSHREPGS
jgi:hypothetical protein